MHSLRTHARAQVEVGRAAGQLHANPRRMTRQRVLGRPGRAHRAQAAGSRVHDAAHAGNLVESVAACKAETSRRKALACRRAGMAYDEPVSCNGPSSSATFTAVWTSYGR